MKWHKTSVKPKMREFCNNGYKRSARLLVYVEGSGIGFGNCSNSFGTIKWIADFVWGEYKVTNWAYFTLPKGVK